jgi:hypothetical protein
VKEEELGRLLTLAKIQHECEKDKGFKCKIQVKDDEVRPTSTNMIL